VLDRATAPQSSALRNPDTRWGSRGDLRPLMGAEVVTPEEPHPNQISAAGAMVTYFTGQAEASLEATIAIATAGLAAAAIGLREVSKLVSLLERSSGRG
jgi:hypothetical protein